MMLARVRAAQSVVDAFAGRPLVWGERDCARLAEAAARALGHAPALPPGRYRTALGARRVLTRAGFADLPDVIDGMFERIAVSRLLPGDLMAGPGAGMSALAMAVGNGKALGFAPDLVCRVGDLRAHEAVIGWRVPCLNS